MFLIRTPEGRRKTEFLDEVKEGPSSRNNLDSTLSQYTDTTPQDLRAWQYYFHVTRVELPGKKDAVSALFSAVEIFAELPRRSGVSWYCQ